MVVSSGHSCRQKESFLPGALVFLLESYGQVLQEECGVKAEAGAAGPSTLSHLHTHL